MSRMSIGDSVVGDRCYSSGRSETVFVYIPFLQAEDISPSQDKDERRRRGESVQPFIQICFRDHKQTQKRTTEAIVGSPRGTTSSLTVDSPLGMSGRSEGDSPFLSRCSNMINKTLERETTLP